MQIDIIPQVQTQLQEIVTRIFGVYEPIRREWTTLEPQLVVTRTDFGYYGGYVETVHEIIHEIPQVEYMFNWSWAVGVLLFSICLYSFLRCVGGILKWKI